MSPALDPCRRQRSPERAPRSDTLPGRETPGSWESSAWTKGTSRSLSPDRGEHWGPQTSARVAEQAVGGKEASGRRAAGWEGALQTPTPACTRRSPGKVVGPRREEIMSDRVWRRSINRMSSDNSGESLARAVEGGPRKPPGCRPRSSVSRGTCGRVPASLPGLRARGPRKAGPPT